DQRPVAAPEVADDRAPAGDVDLAMEARAGPIGEDEIRALVRADHRLLLRRRVEGAGVGADDHPEREFLHERGLAFGEELGAAAFHAAILTALSSRAMSAGARERFEIVRRLGAGGMGVVYEAIDRERGGRVALKTLRQLDAGLLYRFKG